MQLKFLNVHTHSIRILVHESIKMGYVPGWDSTVCFSPKLLLAQAFGQDDRILDATYGTQCPKKAIGAIHNTRVTFNLAVQRQIGAKAGVGEWRIFQNSCRLDNSFYRVPTNLFQMPHSLQCRKKCIFIHLRKKTPRLEIISVTRSIQPRVVIFVILVNNATMSRNKLDESWGKILYSGYVRIQQGSSWHWPFFQYFALDILPASSSYFYFFLSNITKRKTWFRYFGQCPQLPDSFCYSFYHEFILRITEADVGYEILSFTRPTWVFSKLAVSRELSPIVIKNKLFKFSRYFFEKKKKNKDEFFVNFRCTSLHASLHNFLYIGFKGSACWPAPVENCTLLYCISHFACK